MGLNLRAIMAKKKKDNRQENLVITKKKRGILSGMDPTIGEGGAIINCEQRESIIHKAGEDEEEEEIF
jgi:hypothetical protein